MYVILTQRISPFPVEFEKGEDSHVLMTGTWNTTAPASLALSPNAEVLVIAHGSSISFYSIITGVLDTTIEDIFLGKITHIIHTSVFCDGFKELDELFNIHL